MTSLQNTVSLPPLHIGPALFAPTNGYFKKRMNTSEGIYIGVSIPTGS